MKILFLFTLLVLVSVFSINDAFAVKTISDDSTGGDCSIIGTWDSASSTCTLSSDITDGVVIGTNYIILDGNGHTISGDPNGIIIDRKFDVTVKNSNVQNGINIRNSKDITITKNTITGQDYAISVYDSDTIKISENTIANSKTGIQLGFRQVYVEISNNQITHNVIGINRQEGQGMTFRTQSDIIRGNTISDNSSFGIVGTYGIIAKNTISNNGGSGITGSNGEISQNIISGNKQYGISGSRAKVFENLIESNTYGLGSVSNSYNNNIINNGVSHAVDTGGKGGNYWSDYSSKCTDSNYDNFCDKPYPLGSGTADIIDNYVWKLKSGWLTKVTVPDSITLDATDSTGTPYTFTASATSDGKSLSVSCNPLSGSIFPIGKTDIICTAENGVHAKFTITVNNIPPTDTDKDGIPDSTDKCPTQAETINNYHDTDGCPDVVSSTDTDGDGISDSLDPCPFTIETNCDSPKKIKVTLPLNFKNTATAWSLGKITDNQFLQLVQIEINRGTMIIPDVKIDDTGNSGASIPSWAKNNVGWWADGTIDDISYIATIQYFFKDGILPVNVTLKDVPITEPALKPVSTNTIVTIEKSGFSTSCAKSGCYTPVTAGVKYGNIVTMTNTDTTGVHTFTSGTVDGSTPSPDAVFDSGVLMSGDSFTWKANVSGKVPYYCMLHTWMTGTIIIGEATADEKKAAEQKLAEQKLAEQKLAEKKLAEKKLAEKKLAEKKLADEKKAADKKAADKKAADKKAADKKAADKKAADKKAQK